MKIITRKEAKDQKLSKFFTGTPRKRNHLSYRYTNNGNCVACQQLNLSTWRKTNPNYSKDHYHNNIEYRLNQNLQWRKTNPTYVKDYYIKNKDWYQQYYEEHKKITSIQIKNWRKNNPNKIAEYNKFRTTQLLFAIPSWYEEDKINQLYLKRDELNMAWNIQLEVDHIIPIRSKLVCGLHCWANLQLLDKSLNASKGTKFQSDW